MNIEPLSNRPPEIGVTVPFAPAYDRMKLVLFQPFDMVKWLAIGFCAWLAQLGESGSGGGFNYGNHSRFNNINNNLQPAEQLRQWFGSALDYLHANLAWVLPVAVVGALTVLGVGLLFLWLNCRGKFMFLHCVAMNRAEVVVPWNRYAAAANRLFWLRLLVALGWWAVALPLLAAILYLAYRMVIVGEPDAPHLVVAFGLGTVFAFWFLVLWLVSKFLADFVVPIMFLRDGSCLAACREFLGLLTGHLGAFILYILVQIALVIAIATSLLAVFLVTCCLACCLAQLPYIGTVLVLPILVFQRAYSLYFLAQFGPAYDVFPPAAPPVAPCYPTGLRPL